MGSRVTKSQVKVPHFFLKEVAIKHEYNNEYIVCFQNLMRDDQFSDWENIYSTTKSMNKDVMLLPENFQKERIRKAFTCCQCPADF